VSSQALALATGVWPEHLTLTSDLDDGAFLVVDMCCRRAVLTVEPAQGPVTTREWIAMTPATPGASLMMVWADAPAQHLGRVDRVYVDIGLGLLPGPCAPEIRRTVGGGSRLRFAVSSIGGPVTRCWQPRGTVARSCWGRSPARGLVVNRCLP
jgi:hypothetical protein